MPSTKFFFLGFEVDEHLESCLAGCSDSNRTFLEKPEYLERMTIGGKQFLGRRIDGGGIPEASVEDNARNVASLIKRVAVGWNKSPIHAILTAVEEEIIHNDVVVSF